VFKGLNQPGLGAIESGDSIPPDPTGALGPNHYVEMVNSRVAVYDRSTLASPPVAAQAENVFVGGQSSPCDAVIEWDQQASRWLYVALDCPIAKGAQNRLFFGWSKTADPRDLTGGWCKYELPTGNAFDDYPKLGHDDQHIIIGANEFSTSAGPLGFVPVARLFVLPKPRAGDASCPATAPAATSFALTAPSSLPSASPPAISAPEPANIADASATGYVVGTSSSTALGLFEVTGTASAPVVSAERDVQVPSYGVPASVPQPGSSDMLDSSDARLTQAVAHWDPGIGAEGIWTQHTIAGPGGGPSVVRWYELRPGATVPVQLGTIQASAANFAFNAAISPAAGGDSAAVFYNTGGGSQLVDLRAQVRDKSMAPGTTARETVLGTSDEVDADFSCPSQGGGTTCRWGDYAGASPDHQNPDVVWGSGMVNGPVAKNTVVNAVNDAQWKTRNYAVIAVARPVAVFTYSPAAVATGQEVAFDGSGSSDPTEGIASYAWDFGDGTTGAGAKAAHAYAKAGAYAVRLTVTDASGSKDTAVHGVSVADRPPIARFAFAPASPEADQQVSFDSSASSDADGTIGAYSWDFGDGATSAAANPTHRYAGPGSYVVRLTVTDDSGNSASMALPIDVGRAVTAAGGGASPFNQGARRAPVGSPFGPLGVSSPLRLLRMPRRIRFDTFRRAGLVLDLLCQQACRVEVDMRRGRMSLGHTRIALIAGHRTPVRVVPRRALLRRPRAGSTFAITVTVRARAPSGRFSPPVRREVTISA
jgi:chitodextrinase